jgi:RNA polymerase sigma-70 factor (ECF subfamily)
MPQDDIPIRELLQLCLSTDAEEHWREFVRKTQPLMASVIINTVRRWKQSAPSLVDDLIQNTYVKLFDNDKRALRAIRNEHENTIFGYLKVIASNVAKDHFRKPENKADEIELSDAVVPPGPQDRERREFLDKKSQVQEILETLSSSETYDRDVAIFWFFYEQGYTAKEISLMPHLGLTIKGVEAVIFRLTQYVRERLRRQDPKWVIEL